MTPGTPYHSTFSRNVQDWGLSCRNEYLGEIMMASFNLYFSVSIEIKEGYQVLNFPLIKVQTS